MKVATGDMCGHHSKSCEFNQCSKPVRTTQADVWLLIALGGTG